MTRARKDLVDPKVTRFYHCISSCVRQAMLCGEGKEYRKDWIESQLEKLTGAFAIDVCGYAIMDNHLHTMVRLEPEVADDWDAEEVIRRWLIAYPPSESVLKKPAAMKAHISKLAEDKELVEKYRKRLKDLGWFMKALKEPLARLANKEDDCRGAFWAARFKSIGLLDPVAILMACVYIDLNPLAAGIATTPETSKHTSIRQRVKHIMSQEGGKEKLEAARTPSALAYGSLSDQERNHWLCPVEDRRAFGAARAGMLEGFTLASYLTIADISSRVLRPGKATVPQDAPDIFERLGISEEVWNQSIQRLFERNCMRGHYFSTDRAKLRELAERQGKNRLINLDGCPT